MDDKARVKRKSNVDGKKNSADAGREQLQWSRRDALYSIPITMILTMPNNPLELLLVVFSLV